MSVIATVPAIVGATSTRAIAGLCLAATTALLSGCGAGASARPESVVTVTITPTVTARAVPVTTTAPTPASNVRSDVVGRRFDLGTITSVQDEGGVPVILLDRWTAQGVPDSAIAENGVPIHVHSDAPYQNLNSRSTYRIPVARGAVFTYRHCVGIDQPPAQSSSSLEQFNRLPDPEKVVLVRLDSRGQAVSVENDPAC
jgi:hypothetical protein